jgi:hypothetical protein
VIDLAGSRRSGRTESEVAASPGGAGTPTDGWPIKCDSGGCRLPSLHPGCERLRFLSTSEAISPTASTSTRPGDARCFVTTPNRGEPARSTGPARPLKPRPTCACMRTPRSAASPLVPSAGARFKPG